MARTFGAGANRVTGQGHRDPSQVVAFLETLGLSSVRLMAAEEVLAALVLENGYPADATGLETLLAPVLCSSEAETIRFRQRFRAWLAPRPVPPPPLPTPAPVRRLAVWISALALAAVLGTVALVRWNPGRAVPSLPVQSFTTPDQRPIIRETGSVSSGGIPVAGAVLWYRGTTARSDPQGKFEISAPLDSAFPLLVTHSHYSARLVLDLKMDGHALAIEMSPKSGLPDIAPPQSSIELPGVPSLWPAAGAAVLALLLAGVGTWIMLRTLRLRRWTKRLDLRSAELRLGSIPDVLFSSEEAARAAHQLRGSRSFGPQVLAVSDTVRRTSERAGLFSAVYRQRIGIPAYVALLGRLSPRDQLASFRHAMLQRLANQQVRIEVFHFREDPSLCFSAEGEPHSLELLASRYASHTLWVFCDAEQLQDPERGTPAAWLQTAASSWNDALLVVPSEEAGAFRTGLPLGLSACDPSLDGLGAWAADERAPHGAAAGFYPQTLRYMPEVWIGGHAQPLRATSMLCAELRHYLGRNGYRCLAACAMYPALFWELTVWYASQLLRDDAERAETVRRIVTLPWFRQGSMPEWFRERLLAGLGEAEEAELRRLLDDFLSRPAAPEGAVLELQVGKRRKARSRTMRDYVLLSFLLRVRRDPLSVRPPGALRRRLLEFGILWRPAMALLPACVAIAALAYPYLERGLATPPLTVRVKPATAPAVPQGSDAPSSPKVDPFLARVLDVAASQVGNVVNAPAFMNWAFSETAEIVPANIRRLTPVAARNEQEQWTNALAVSAIVQNERAKIVPGMVCAEYTATSYAPATVGIVETVGNGRLVMIGRTSSKSPVRRFQDDRRFHIGCLDYATVRLADGKAAVPPNDSSALPSSHPPPDDDVESFREKPGTEKARWVIKTSLPDGVRANDSGVLVSLAKLLALQAAADRMTADYEYRRYPKTPDADLAEGEIVRTRGYFRLLAGEGDGDYHIQISETPDTFDNSLVVEVPKDDPTFIAKAPEVLDAARAVRQWLNTNLRFPKSPSGRVFVYPNPPFVEVTGQLFFDAEHFMANTRGSFRGKSINGTQLPSKTAWEIHPVLRIAFAPAPE
jgi:hypothetical protein